MKRVMLLLGYYEHEIYRGVLAFAVKHDWVLYKPLFLDTNQLKELMPRYDGIISLHASNPQIIELIEYTELPFVDIGRDIGFDCPRVYTDNYSIGKQGAEHFIERGIQNLCFIDTGTVLHHEAERLAGFNEAAENAGRNIVQLNYSGMEDVYSQFRDDLGKVPKPLGLMCTSDILANVLIQESLAAGYHVPGEVAVLGVVSEKIFGESTSIPISCVDSNCFDLGYYAADALQRVIQGETPPDLKLIPPNGVFCRQSTDLMAIDHPQLVKAIAYMRENFSSLISVDDIVHQVDISHRQLNKLFIKFLGQTILKELTRLRLNQACQLLKTTDLKAREIAGASGFSSSHRMNVVFKRELNMTPGEYRENKGAYYGN